MFRLWAVQGVAHACKSGVAKCKVEHKVTVHDMKNEVVTKLLIVLTWQRILKI